MSKFSKEEYNVSLNHKGLKIGALINNWKVIIVGQIMEAVMIICFGLAWPVSVYKSYVSRSTRGKSFLFLLIVLAGYLAGMVHVILDYPGFSYLTALYLVNTFMISIDIYLFLRNRKFEALSSC